MTTATLHYIFDPLCGWCYAAAPLLEAARKIPGLAIELHAGGLLSGCNRRLVTPQWRAFVLPHDQRISAMSGQPFGEAYLNGLLNDTTAMLDSTPPIAAILAAQELSGDGMPMLRRIQHAYYVEGLRIADAPVLQDLAEQTGLDAIAFATAYAAMLGEPVNEHTAQSRMLLRRVGASGFPTFVWDRPGNSPAVLESGSFLGQTQAWVEHLTRGLVAA